MVNFEASILAAPQGFTSGCVQLAKIGEPGELEAVIAAAVAASRGGAGYLASSSVTAKEGAKALMYIIHARNSSTPTPEVTELAAVLDSHTTLSRACITSLVAGLESYPVPKHGGLSGDASPEETPAGSWRGGTLAGLQWRLGVSLASSSCKSLLSPYVALSFNVTDGNGESKVHTTELSYAEFAQLHASLREVAARMDSL